jgi:hypothetical protein
MNRAECSEEAVFSGRARPLLGRVAGGTRDHPQIPFGDALAGGAAGCAGRCSLLLYRRQPWLGPDRDVFRSSIRFLPLCGICRGGCDRSRTRSGSHHVAWHASRAATSCALCPARDPCRYGSDRAPECSHRFVGAPGRMVANALVVVRSGDP